MFQQDVHTIQQTLRALRHATLEEMVFFVAQLQFAAMLCRAIREQCFAWQLPERAERADQLATDIANLAKLGVQFRQLGITDADMKARLNKVEAALREVAD